MSLSTNEIITLIIAGWGALLSTILAIYQFRKDIYRVRLEITHEVQEDNRNNSNFEYMGDYSFNVVNITITNISSKPIEINSVGLITNTKEVFKILRTNRNFKVLPQMMKENESITLFAHLSDLYKFRESCKNSSKQNIEFSYTQFIVSDNLGHTFRKKIPKKIIADLKDFKP